MTKTSSTNKPALTMEELLASQPQKLVTLYRGQNIEGTVVFISDKDLILDLGSKSEGVLLKRELSESQLKDLKVGSKIKAYVVMTENDQGQVVLSLSSSAHLDSKSTRRSSSRRGGSFKGGRFINWSQFIQVQNQKSKLQGKVLEVNKGGLIVTVGEVRGFLPNSQVGFELMSKAGPAPDGAGAGKGMESLIGEDLTVTVIEVDQDNNKLIFSQRGAISGDVKTKLESFKSGQKAQGKIIAILPFGLVVDVAGAEGLVFISDVSWDRVEDLSKIFTVGQDVEVKILNSDLELGRLNLSIKELTEDPFAKLAEKFPADEVVKGEITGVSDGGVTVKLADGIEGFLPSSKITPEASYEAGKTMTFLVDSIDSHKRRVNLAPFVTSTAGLIYK